MRTIHLLLLIPAAVGASFVAGAVSRIETRENRCYTEMVLPNTGGYKQRFWMECSTIPPFVKDPATTVGKSPWSRPRVHPVKIYYDHAPEYKEARQRVAPGKGTCKPGRTRNLAGVCGRWRNP